MEYGYASTPTWGYLEEDLKEFFKCSVLQNCFTVTALNLPNVPITDRKSNQARKKFLLFAVSKTTRATYGLTKRVAGATNNQQAIQPQILTNVSISPLYCSPWNSLLVHIDGFNLPYMPYMHWHLTVTWIPAPLLFSGKVRHYKFRNYLLCVAGMNAKRNRVGYRQIATIVLTNLNFVRRFFKCLSFTQACMRLGRKKRSVPARWRQWMETENQYWGTEPKRRGVLKRSRGLVHVLYLYNFSVWLIGLLELLTLRFALRGGIINASTL